MGILPGKYRPNLNFKYLPKSEIPPRYLPKYRQSINLPYPDFDRKLFTKSKILYAQ